MTRNYTFFLICFLFFFSSTFSKQDNNLSDTAQWYIDEINVDQHYIDSLNNVCFELRGSDPAKAIFIGKRALKLAKKINYAKGYLMSHSFIGVCYRNISDFTTAMNYYSKSFFLADSLNDKEQKAYAYNNIGNLYLKQNKDSLALRNILGGLKLAEELNNQRIIAYSHINLGRIYSNLGQWNESVKYLTYAVHRRKKMKDYWGVSNTLIEVAEVFRKSKKYNLSIKTLNDAFRIADTLENAQRLISEIYTGKGKTFSDLGKYSEANINFIKALTIAKGIDDKIKIMQNYYNLSLISEKLNNQKLALDYHKKYVNYKDSVYTIDTQNQISRLQIQYQTKEMDKENELLRQSNKIQELELSKNRTVVNLFVVIFVLLISLAGIIYSKLKANQKTARILKNKNKEILKQKLELSELNATKDKFFSIIGHDLKNPFGSLIGNTEYLIEELEGLSLEENKKILDAIRSSSKSGYNLLENLLLWAKTQQGKIKFNEEEFNLNELIESKIQLHQNTAILKKITLNSNLKDSIQVVADKKMMDTVINNLINNALKFTNEYGEVLVEAKKTEDKIIISVTDNGMGILPEEKENIFKLDKKESSTGTQGETGTGLGLIICKEFIDAHKGSINIQSEYDEGTKVTVEIPVKKS